MSGKDRTVDLVDENDQIVGTVNRDDAHNSRALHRVVAIFVFDKSGKLIVQVHKKSGGLLDNTVGGHVEIGETYDQAAKREAKEELGLDQELDFVARFYSDETFQGSNYRHMFALYAVEAAPSWSFEPNQEVNELVSMGINQIWEEMQTNPKHFTSGFINAVNVYLFVDGRDIELAHARVLQDPRV